MSVRNPAVPVDVSVLKEKLYFKTSKRTASNRFLKAALTERTATWVPNNPNTSGLPTSQLGRLYDKWCRGGFGMVLTGNIPRHLESAGNMYIDERCETAERRLAFREFVSLAKSGGESLLVAQLSHAGRLVPMLINSEPFSSSDIRLEMKRRGMGFGQPKALTDEEIRTEVIDRFVYAAQYAYDVGFDGIELHCAHGYLLAQFISPSTNKRNDKYGGSPINRIRLLLEIFKAIRQQIPPETGFIIGVKLNSVEFQDNGLSAEDAAIMCEAVDAAGFDFVELSGGTIEKIGFTHLKESTRFREAFFLEFAEKITPIMKSAVVYLTGGFRTAHGMVSAVKDGVTMGIGLGRPVAAEPDLPKKILNGFCDSALKSVVEEDFALGNMAANTQMMQIGSTSLAESNNNLCYGVIDLSTAETARPFTEALPLYLKQMEETVESGNPVAGVLELPLNIPN